MVDLPIWWKDYVDVGDVMDLMLWKSTQSHNNRDNFIL